MVTEVKHYNYVFDETPKKFRLNTVFLNSLSRSSDFNYSNSHFFQTSNSLHSPHLLKNNLSYFSEGWQKKSSSLSA